MEHGTHNKLPHYSVVGSSVNFYVWVNEDGRGSSSTWIKGRADLWHKLQRLYKKDRKAFIIFLKEQYNANS